MDRVARFERIKRIAPAIVLSLGAIGLSACSNDEPAPVSEHGSGSDSDIQKEISTIIGQYTGVYDKDGNVIPHRQQAESKDE